MTMVDELSACAPWATGHGVRADDDDDAAAALAAAVHAPSLAAQGVTPRAGALPSPRTSDVARLPPASASDGDGRADDVASERKHFRRLLRRSSIFFDTYPRDVVLQQALEMGITRAKAADAATLLWYEADPPSLDVLRAMTSKQRINCYPGMKLLATKCEFARLVNLARAMTAGTSQSTLLDFVPQTYVLPRDRESLAREQAGQSHVFVVKPDAGCGGDGIYLTKDVTKIRHPECVVQRYIADPLLLGGLKFDLRVYVLVTSLRPLRFFVHKEGLARMAVEPYEVPSAKNLYKLNMHLTNYSLNKFSSTFVPNTDAFADEACSKRSIATAFRQLLAEHGPDVFDEEAVWASIAGIAEATLAVLLPSLLMAAKEREAAGAAGASSLTDRCFQIMGFDVLLDRQCRAHLLEVNHHPSLQTDAPIDTLVKGSLLKHTLRIVSHAAAATAAATAAARRRSSKPSKKATKAAAASLLGVLSGEDEDDADDGSDETASLAATGTESRADWELAVAGPRFIPITSTAADFAAGTPLCRRFNLPLNVIREVFLEGGEDARSRKACSACSMTSLKFAKFMRKTGIVPTLISSGHADLMYIRAGKQGTNGGLSFLDFVALAFEELGDLVAPETLQGTSERLAAVANYLAAALPAQE